MYACGPTVYRDAHLGNMRTFLLPDLIARTAAARGINVLLVQNITDVGHMLDDTGLGDVDEGLAGEDRLLSASANEGRGALDIAREYESRFAADCERLGIIEPAQRPRASECIDLMLDLIAGLVASDHAYVGGDGSVYFAAASLSDYGAISGNRLDQLKPGHRFEGRIDPNKRFHADWALWKLAPATRTQLVWDSPWGVGFPGWHIECSAMLLAYLGDTVDIHTGGIDLRFPHHEDERAQTNASAGREVVRHWVHGEHLLFEGRKMSKSAGNVVLLDDVVARGFDPRALRAAFLHTHYRTQVDLTWDAIAAADTLLRRWRQLVASATPAGGDEHAAAHYDDAVWQQVLGLFEDDLATAQAMVLLRAFAKDAGVPADIRAATLIKCDELLGLDLLTAHPSSAGTNNDADIPSDVAELLQRRATARESRDWSLSDALRDDIANLGWTVIDGPDGQHAAPSRN